MFFKRVPSIHASDVTSLPSTIKIIDVREAYEFKSGHIPGSINVPLRTMNNYQPKGKVYLVCQSGMRSKMAAKRLIKKGYDAINIRGGVNAWIRGGK